MKRTGVAVHIEGYGFASTTEVRLVLERYGFRATVTPSIHFGPPPVGAPPDYLVITVLVAALTTFFNGFISAAGKDAWEALKRCLTEMGQTRSQGRTAVGTGRVVLHDPLRHIELLIPSDLPDEGFRALFTQDASTFPERSVLEYDRERGVWRQSGTLKPASPGKPLMIFHPTFVVTVTPYSLPPGDEDEAD